MSLATGTRIKVLSINSEMITGSDWMNEREPEIGDEAIIESISASEKGTIVRLLCEPIVGFLEWRVDIYEEGLEYEQIRRAHNE